MVFSISTNSERYSNYASNYELIVLFLVYISYHHYLLWDRGRPALIALVTSLCITYVPAIVIGLNSVFQYRSKHCYRRIVVFAFLTYTTEVIFYLPIIDQCVLTKQPSLAVGYWACLVCTHAQILNVLFNAFYTRLLSMSWPCAFLRSIHYTDLIVKTQMSYHLLEGTVPFGS